MAGNPNIPPQPVDSKLSEAVAHGVIYGERVVDDEQEYTAEDGAFMRACMGYAMRTFPDETTRRALMEGALLALRFHNRLDSVSNFNPADEFLDVTGVPGNIPPHQLFGQGDQHAN